MRARLSVLLSRVADSASVRAAAGFAIGGAVFALANLLLARYLDTIDYALLALVLALKELGGGLGMAGLDLVVNRHRLAPTVRLALRTVFTSFFAGVSVFVIATNVYEMSFTLASFSLLIVVGFSMCGIAAAFFQSDERFVSALVLIQIHNFVLLALIPVGLALGRLTVEFALATVALAYLAVAVAGWLLARRRLASGRATASEATLAREGLGGLGIGLATLIMWQIERLTIPLTLTLDDLATFGVLAAIVGAPFRMMQIGVGYTLLPRIRSASEPTDIRRLVFDELRLASVICIGGAALILSFGPLVIELLTDGKYEVTLDLFVAAILVGYVRIWQGIAVAAASAMADGRTLQKLSLAGWIALLVAVGGAWQLGRFGLQWLIYGAGLGWLFQASIATHLARVAMRNRWQAHRK